MSKWESLVAGTLSAESIYSISICLLVPIYLRVGQVLSKHDVYFQERRADGGYLIPVYILAVVYAGNLLVLLFDIFTAYFMDKQDVVLARQCASYVVFTVLILFYKSSSLVETSVLIYEFLSFSAILVYMVLDKDKSLFNYRDFFLFWILLGACIFSVHGLCFLLVRACRYTPCLQLPGSWLEEATAASSCEVRWVSLSTIYFCYLGSAFLTFHLDPWLNIPLILPEFLFMIYFHELLYYIFREQVGYSQLTTEPGPAAEAVELGKTATPTNG
jgi:hypothetical protein